MSHSTFADKFIKRLQRIDRPQIESFLHQLLREKAFNRAVFDSISEGIIVVDGDEKVVFLNEAARSLLGIGSRKALGEPFRRILRAKAIISVVDEYAEQLLPITSREVRVRTPKPGIYSITAAPVQEEETEDPHVVWILNDRTDVHRRAAERQQMESMKSLVTLTAGIAHEIKNPLNSLNIHAQLIAKAAKDFARDQEDSPQLQRLSRSTNVLLEEIERLSRIVEQFNNAVRPMKIRAMPSNINDVAKAVAELIGPECESRGIDLTLDLDPIIPLLRMDAERVQQAILNLAKNAMEAIEKPEGRVEIRTSLHDDHVLIEVEDNGVGVAEKDRLAIFEPFHTTKFTGSGLGLMVVFRIISAHRGAIGLDSEVGVGSIFKLALPLDERPVRLLEASVSANTDTPPPTLVEPV